MRVSVLTSLDELVDVAGHWKELADVCGGRATTQPFWCLPWWRRLGQGVPLVVTVHADGRLVALGPLHERRMAGLRVVRFLGHNLGAVSEVLAAPGFEASASQVWACLLGGRRRYLQLAECRADCAALIGLREASPRAVIEPSNACRTLCVPDSVEAYLAERPKGLRRSLRRADERLDDEGCSHSVEVVAEPGRVAEVLSELVGVCDDAESQRPRQNLLAGAWAPFTTDLLETAAAAGRLRLFVGRIDGSPVSFDLGLLSGGRLELWLGRYSPAWARFSPGHLSMRAVLHHAVETGVAEVDLGLGDDQYKRLWCPSRYATVSVTAASSPATMRFGAGVLSARRRLWEWRGRAGRVRPAGRGPVPATR